MKIKIVNQRFVYMAIAILLFIILLAACVPDSAQPPAQDNASAPEATEELVEENKESTGNESSAKVNLNMATREELLAAIPGLGEKMADEFEEYRPFLSIAHFRQEMGKYVDEAQLDEYEKFVYIPLNVNEAEVEDFLATIPGLGEKMADEFMEYRPFLSILQFRQEMGKYADEAQIAEYEEYIYIPVDINESDKATLQATLDVSESVITELMAARPYDSTAAFLTALAEYAPEVDQDIVESYLVSK